MEKTCDTLFQGRLHCNQYTYGYRFSIDAVLVAHFCRIGPQDMVLDLGCGSGVIGLVLAYRYHDITVHGLEVQESMAALARENIVLNKLDQRMRITIGDACTIKQSVQVESFDHVVCNPPYGKRERGRLNRHASVSTARHELCGELYDFIKASAFSVKNRKKVTFIYPASGSATLITQLHDNRLIVKRLQSVYSYPGDQNAKLIMVEAMKNGGDHCEVLPPLYIYTAKDGQYSEEVKAMYRE